MIKTITLAAHDAMPAGPGRQLLVLRRFKEDAPAETTVQFILTGRPEQSSHPMNADGTPMHLDQAIIAARQVAAEEGLQEIYVIDRLGGAREQDILHHDGDHSVHMSRLSDTDTEEGIAGSDMRDIAHRTQSV